MGKSGNFCPGLRLALTLKRVAAGPKIASFLREFSGEKRGLFESNSPQGLLTENGRISKPKPRSLVGTLFENSRKPLIVTYCLLLSPKTAGLDIHMII